MTWTGIQRRILRVGVVVLMLTALPALAQEFEAYPLRPPDTSSPRATFKSFISNMNLAVQAHKNDDEYESRKAWDAAVRRYMDKALHTLDLSDEQPANRRRLGVNAAVQREFGHGKAFRFAAPAERFRLRVGCGPLERSPLRERGRRGD